MIYPFSIDIRNYRSIDGECFVPFSKKTTFIVGQNNSGKSNILRALASIFNKKYDFGAKIYRYDIIIKNFHLKDFGSTYNALSRYTNNLDSDLTIPIKNDRAPTTPLEPLFQYASTRGYLNDFGNSSNPEANYARLTQKIIESVEGNFNGTIYVPNTRYITTTGREPDTFSKPEIAGNILGYGGIVDDLASLNHPRTENRDTSREKFKKIEDFLSFCLDKSSVRIEVPFDKSTIHVNIEGQEHPLQDLGTGIEQLIIIGLASFGFSQKLILVDEPELHFHPTVQKRIIRYLNENVDAKFVFATHSAAILDAVEADVLQVSNDGQRSHIKTVESNRDRYVAVRDLGHAPSDLLLTKFAIWVEGPSDRVYINHWIKRVAPDLGEGVDYTILFYGGKILSHHSFIDDNSELVKAISLARAFAVVMDSDRNPKKPNINKTKARVRDEITSQGGICWITEGREVENYLPDNVIQQLISDFPGTKLPTTKLDQILDPDKVRKNEFARTAIKVQSDEWPLDLRARINELVAAIRAAG